MIDLPSISEALAGAVASAIARTWRRIDGSQLDEEAEDLDDE
jgi:hypothetical protein